MDYTESDTQRWRHHWTTRDSYLADFPEKDRDYLFCDHCRSTLILRPFFFNGELFMECQVCKFTYSNNGVIKELLSTGSGQ